MSKIEHNNPIHNAVEGIESIESHRNYIGYSSLLGKCKRKTWIDFRHMYQKKISARIKRLFNRGEQEEPVIIKGLEAAGMVVFDTQREITNPDYPLVKGHIDGLVKNVPGHGDEVMLLEMKTANNNNFSKMAKVGIKAYSSAYWGQINGYMKELSLQKCLYIVTNKNNDQRLYIVYNRDEIAIADFPYIIQDIMDSNAIPAKIGGATWYECKYCDAYYLCQYGEQFTQHCRNCSNYNLLTQECSLGNGDKVCDDYVTLKSMI